MTDQQTQFSIRPMVYADLESVQALAACLPNAPSWAREAYETALNPNSIPRRVALITTAGPSDELAGFVIANLIPPQAELESIAVAPNFQRRGLGRQLFHALVAGLCPLGALELTLEVRASNTAAVAFYKSLGFHFRGLRPRYYVDPIENAVMMALSLK
jgi:[ribosomal protein S18]-alanine N-acetyltransferase